jgi:hypothetical protein
MATDHHRLIVPMLVGFALAATAPAAQPPTTSPRASTLAGNWQGSLKVSLVELRLAFHVTPSKDDPETLTATFDNLDQGATGLPVDSVALAEDGTVTFTLKKLVSTYQGKLSDDGTQIDGAWTQAGVKMPLVLTRTDKVAEIRRPQTPVG